MPFLRSWGFERSEGRFEGGRVPRRRFPFYMIQQSSGILGTPSGPNSIPANQRLVSESAPTLIAARLTRWHISHDLFRRSTTLIHLSNQFRHFLLSLFSPNFFFW